MTLKIRPNAIEQDHGPFTFPGVRLPNDGLHILDTDASHHLIIKPGSDLSADRILTITTGDAARTITLSGNPTLGDWFDQGVKQADSPTFGGLTINGAIALDGDLNFQGPQAITTTAGDLRLVSAGDIILTPSGDQVFLRPDTGVLAQFFLDSDIDTVNAIASLHFRGHNDAAENISYAYFRANIRAFGDGIESGSLTLYTVSVGATRNMMTCYGDVGTVFNEAGADLDFRVESAINTHALFLRGSDGKASIGIATPDGTLHVHTATAGAVTASTIADELIVENATDGGISILTPDNKSGRLYFGNPTANDYHGIKALGPSHATNPAEFIIRVASSDRINLTTTRMKLEMPILIKEAADDAAHVASYGQLWILNDAPNILMFTDDAGTKFTVDVTPV